MTVQRLSIKALNSLLDGKTREAATCLIKFYSNEWVRRNVLRQTDSEMLEMDEQIEKEIEAGIIPDPAAIDPITGEPLPDEGDMGMMDMPLEADGAITNGQLGKDTKKAEI